jgi:hypothetical protein
MPRPHASPEIKALALDFACVVTTDEGADGSSFVARHGPHSIYAVLTRCCVGAIRDDTPESNRKGISEAEFLRTLAERAKPVHNREFLRYRDRKAVKMSEDPTGAGMCMFRNVRWRSPANPTDLKYLREQHKHLSKKYPLVAGTVLSSWLKTLTAVTSAWEDGRLWAPVKSLSPTERLSQQSSDDAFISSTSSTPVSSPPDSEASSPRCVDVDFRCLARKRGRDWPEHDGMPASSQTKVIKTLPTHLAVSRSQDRQGVPRPNRRLHVSQVHAQATQAPVKEVPPCRGDSPVSAQPRVSASTTSSFALCGSSHCSGKDVVVPVPSFESLAPADLSLAVALAALTTGYLAEPERHKPRLETEHPDLLQAVTGSDDGLWEMWPLDLEDVSEFRVQGQELCGLVL